MQLKWYATSNYLLSTLEEAKTVHYYLVVSGLLGLVWVGIGSWDAANIVMWEKRKSDRFLTIMDNVHAMVYNFKRNLLDAAILENMSKILVR